MRFSVSPSAEGWYGCCCCSTNACVKHTHTPVAAGMESRWHMVQHAVWDQIVWLSAHGTPTSVEVLMLAAVRLL